MDVNKVIIGGVERYCGLLPTPPETKKLFAAPPLKLIPEKEWVEIDNSMFITSILDQGNQGACVGFSGTQSLMIARAREGLPYVELSAGCLYGQINGGRDAGANIGDALIALKDVGVCKASTIGQSEWKKARSSSAWKEEAKSYRSDEGYVCALDEYLTGLQNGWAGNFGVAANSRFDTDSEGYMPATGSGINHSVLACGMKKNTKGQWFVIMCNSWGADWGKSGFGYYPVDGLVSDEYWLIRSTTIA